LDALARKQFDFYSNELTYANPYSSANDNELVAHAREYLSQFAGFERVYQFMLTEGSTARPGDQLCAPVPRKCRYGFRFVRGPGRLYMKALAALQVSLEQAAAGSGQPNDTPVAQRLSSAENAILVTRQIAQTFSIDPAGHTESTVEKLMEDPIAYSQAVLRDAGPAELNGKGKEFCTQ
jgi:hypothetical protein